MSKSIDETKRILDEIEKLFPNAACELVYHNIYELSVATILSAQATDKSVNKITPQLFSKYPNPVALGNALYEDVYAIIKSIGLAKMKTKHIIGFAKEVSDKYSSIVPKTFVELTNLSGVGRKTANVILVEGYRIPRIPVDTHVERVTKRLEIVEENDSVIKVEEKLMELIPSSRWHQAHHLFLFFGRYFCVAKKPNCEACFNRINCKYKNTH